MAQKISKETIERMDGLSSINLQNQLAETLHELSTDFWSEGFDLEDIEAYLKMKCETIIKEFTQQ